MTISRRVAIIGDGKMGRMVASVAAERGHHVVATLTASRNPDGSGISPQSLDAPDVAIEFTAPGAALSNVLACLRARIPVVVGTTGWYDQLVLVQHEVAAQDGSVFYAPNFSLGVALFIQIAEQAAQAMRDVEEFDPQIVETHHRSKRDAPSGTAASLAARLRAPLGREVPITSVRVGSVPGTHEVLFDAPFEQIRLTHEARDRRVFAAGAVRAAEWLVGRQGLFTMRDMLQLTTEH